MKSTWRCPPSGIDDQPTNTCPLDPDLGVAPQNSRFRFKTNYAAMAVAADLPEWVEAKHIMVIPGLVHLGGLQVVSDLIPIPLPYFLDQLAEPEVEASTPGSAKKAKTVDPHHEKLVVQYPRLSSWFQKMID